MISIETRSRYQHIAATGAGDAWALAKACRSGDFAAAADLSALLARAGWIEPGHILATYDAAAAGWSGEAQLAADLTGGASEVPSALWSHLWDFLEDETPMDAGGFTARTAALAGHLGTDFLPRAIASSLDFKGVAEVAAQGWPEKFRLEDLARCPANSLGGEFHALIVDNRFDLEVLDRDALGLSKLPPPLDYLNARALQCHDLWHIVGGYRTTGLHEVAISAFQLAQFGHNYSAQFLAVVTANVAFRRPEGMPILFETIFSAWRHGRQTPPLLGVHWESIWHKPVEVIRDLLGVKPYPSPFPADLFEQLRAAA
jgi:ubiquinone biosynthesis protein Coq4